jgi:hypothetical protein
LIWVELKTLVYQQHAALSQPNEPLLMVNLDSRLATAERPQRPSRHRRGTPSRPIARPLETAAAFKAAIYQKGWSIVGLAKHWGMTREWLLKLAADTERPRYFDDAVRGLPRIGKPIPLRAQWSAALDGRDAPAPVAKPGFRYRGYLTVGTVVVATRYIGSIADEGMRGLVVQVLVDSDEERYRVLFETGELELFDPASVDMYLQDVGLQQEALRPYRYIDDNQVRRDYDDGMFDFGQGA